MAVDHLAVIEEESARIVAALAADRDGRVPWSERWTVATVAKHVGGTHHVVAQIIDGRPTADFGLFGSLVSPDKADPGLGAWLTEGTAALAAQLRATDPASPCWSWTRHGTTVAFWARRMAQETLVHRWDAEAGAGTTSQPMDPQVAADGIDEYLHVFVDATRSLGSAPAGPSFAFEATDTEGAWVLELPVPGERVLTRGHADADVRLRGPAEGLLLMTWGRLDANAAGVEVSGATDALDRWAELLPPM